MKDTQNFINALNNKKIPLLVLDQKWHRLFAIHGKTEEIKQLESEINGLLAKQGKLNTRLKELKKLKGQLLDSIVQNMDEGLDKKALAQREKKQEETKKLIDEANEKLDECEDELAEIPNLIRKNNEQLMLSSMDYFYDKIRVNQEESNEIEEWINNIRIELKKNIIRKQNRDINNREIYAYLHDIFGAEVIDIFDIKYEEESESEESNN